MFSKTFILTLFATAAIAAPGVPVPNSRISLCDYTDLLGSCSYLNFTPGQCIWVGSVAGKVTSLDSYSWKCRYYADKKCQGDNIPTEGRINNIGASQYSSMNNWINYVQCFEKW